MKVKLVNPIINENYGAELLKFYGVQDIDWYLEPTDPKYLQSPYGLSNLGEGAAVLRKGLADAKSDNKSILIIVDCDNDGFTSAAIMYQYIKFMDPDVKITYWLHEGKSHGLEDMIDGLLMDEDMYSLVILPDSSSNDYMYHEALSIPCLVLDHHLAEPPYSSKAVIINNQLSPDYINKDLTGAGVVWQFCRYLDMLFETHYADDLIDLAAWGIIGDMGSLLSNENRYIIYNGLNHIKNFFFKALIDKQDYSMGGEVNPMTVAFYIVPLTNAMIRVGTMEEKKRLFEAYIDGEKMIVSHKRGANGALERAAVESARECTNARARQNRIKDEVVEKLEVKIHKYDLLENKILFVRLEDDDQFPSELNGLIATQLAAKFKKPTIVARLNVEGYDRGSIRGMNQSALTSFKDYLDSTGLFEYVQGHDNAAGCSIKDEYLKQFHDKANQELANIDFGESIFNVNFELEANEIDKLKEIIFDLNKYHSLWGQNMPEPLIYIKNIKVKPYQCQVIGKDSSTFRIDYNGMVFIKFHAKDMIEELSKFEEIGIDIVGKPNVNNWMGNETPQIMIEQYEAHDSSFDF